MKTTLTKEQSERLIDLGVNWHETTYGKVKGIIDNAFKITDKPKEDVFLFSLLDLLEILPKKITDRQKVYELKIWVDHYSESWCVDYDCANDVCSDLDLMQSEDEYIDAIYAMLVALKNDSNLKWL